MAIAVVVRRQNSIRPRDRKSREAAENKVNVELILFSEAKRRMLAVLLRARQAPRHIMLFVAVVVSLA
jgi:hypothetical protein